MPAKNYHTKVVRYVKKDGTISEYIIKQKYESRKSKVISNSDSDTICKKLLSCNDHDTITSTISAIKSEYKINTEVILRLLIAHNSTF